MTLPSSGAITLEMIAEELGVGMPIDLNAANVRSLAGVASGPITMPNDFYGKSSVSVAITVGQLDETGGTFRTQRYYPRAVVTGGTPTSYSWGHTFSLAYPSYVGSTTATPSLTSTYNSTQANGVETATITVTVVIAGVTYTASAMAGFNYVQF